MSKPLEAISVATNTFTWPDWNDSHASSRCYEINIKISQRFYLWQHCTVKSSCFVALLSEEVLGSPAAVYSVAKDDGAFRSVALHHT